MFIKDILIRRKNSNKIAIKQGNDVISYSELYTCAKENSEYLKDKIPNNQKNTGIFLPNSIQYAQAYFTAAFLNNVIVPIEIQCKKLDLKSIIKYCEIKLIITNSKFKLILLDNLKDEDILKDIIIFDLDSKVLVSSSDIALSEDNKNSSEYKPTENDVAIMLHTSGTTSHPKRVMLTHKNLISNIESNIQSLQLTEKDITLISLPMFFGYCNTSQFLTHLYLGAQIVILDSMFLPDIFLRIVEKNKITNLTVVPSMLLMLAKWDKDISSYDISQLKYICFGGGSLSTEIIKELIFKYPSVGFIQTYGQTEASPRVTYLRKEDSLRKLGSVGKPIPNVKVRIVNNYGEDVKVGEIGEIIVYGDNIMKGYYKRKKETDAVLKNGWLFTGDFGKYDDEGFIYVIGRKKNIIISGGINIYPEEIESILLSYPLVKEVIVFSEKHDILGEVPIAKIVLKDNGSVSVNELKQFCFKNMCSYKIPKKIIFVDNLSKTFTGKVRRY